MENNNFRNNHKKRIFTFVLIEIISVFLLIIILLTESTQATQEEAKTKVEEAVDKSYVAEDIVDIKALKNNIQKDINNATITSNDDTKFPIDVVVDGYEFKVEENGTVKVEEENEKMEDKESKNKNKKEDNKENIKQPIIKYSNESKTEKGITITTTESGEVTIKGKSTEPLYIKISNNLQISNTTDSFNKWKEEDGIIIPKGTLIKQKIIGLEGTIIGGQVNLVLRTEDNQALGKLKLADNEKEYISVLNDNIIANYIYIKNGVEVDNIKFKVEITEEEPNQEDLQQVESKSDKGIECTVNSDGFVKLNGVATDNLYIKITNGINITSNGTANIKLAQTEPIIFKKNAKVHISIKELAGTVNITNSNQECNLVIKYQDGTIGSKCEMAKKIFEKEADLEQPATMLYIYITKGVKFENYVIKPDITEI